MSSRFATKLAWLPGSVVACCTILSDRALAGPWAQDKGAWLGIADVSYERSGQQLDKTGWRSGYYAEFGPTHTWTFVAKTQSLLRDNQSRHSVDIGLHKELWRGQRTALGFQIQTLLGQSLHGPSCGQGIGAHASLGTSYNLGTMNGFAVVDATLHYRGDTCPRQKASLVIGLDPTPAWQAIAKAFYENSSGVVSVKLEGSMARRISGNLAVGLGYRTEVGGHFLEQAGLIFVQKQGRIGK